MNLEKSVGSWFLAQTIDSHPTDLSRMKGIKIAVIKRKLGCHLFYREEHEGLEDRALYYIE